MRRKGCAGAISIPIRSNNLETGSRLLLRRAFASRQSEVIDGRPVLDARLAEMTERFGEGPIPLPPHWGGYRVKPAIIEFWQGRANRLHDRFRYTRKADSAWQIDRLAP